MWKTKNKKQKAIIKKIGLFSPARVWDLTKKGVVVTSLLLGARAGSNIAQNNLNAVTEIAIQQSYDVAREEASRAHTRAFHEARHQDDQDAIALRWEDKFMQLLDDLGVSLYDDWRDLSDEVQEAIRSIEGQFLSENRDRSMMHFMETFRTDEELSRLMQERFPVNTFENGILRISYLNDKENYLNATSEDRLTWVTGITTRGIQSGKLQLRDIVGETGARFGLLNPTHGAVIGAGTGAAISGAAVMGGELLVKAFAKRKEDKNQAAAEIEENKTAVDTIKKEIDHADDRTL